MRSMGPVAAWVTLAGVAQAGPAGAQAPPGRMGEPARTPAEPPPLGLDAWLPAPLDNRPTPARVGLGERLFGDPVLSADSSLACADCHHPGYAFAAPLSVARGVRGSRGTRNALSLLNRGYLDRFFWDGRASSLEEAVLMPISNPDELGLDLARAVTRLRRDSVYVSAFMEAYGQTPSIPGLARALASYVRSLRSGAAPADLHAAGKRSAFGPAARRGRALFMGEAACWLCHSGPLLSDGRLHNTGVSWGSADTGAHLRTGREEDRGLFRTAPLRDVALTAPYMHDGSLETLEDVVAFYAQGGGPNPNLAPVLRSLRLTPAQQADLLAFLRSLTGTVR